ncbi:MAG: YgiT-type zinc finger protein [Planctomycetes bacterium]|nr:YgiT-type zinc finger protein [Planctomycetota bacterium]
MTCDTCGNATFRYQTVTRLFSVEGRVLVVEGIPAEVCDRCEAATFSRETAERLRTLVHEPHVGGRPIPAEVIPFQAA